MANGFEAIQLNIILKIAAFIFLAPFIGMVIAFGFTLFVLYICRRSQLIRGAYLPGRWPSGLPLSAELPTAPATWASSLRCITSPVPSA